MRTGHADAPLHGGRAPKLLFGRMTALAREMSLAVLAEEGPHGRLRRLSDPIWFQGFGCVLGFDWHSSGLTTTVCGALKEGLREVADSPVVVAGGKGRASRRTPTEIEAAGERLGVDPVPLVRASRLSKGRLVRGAGRVPGVPPRVRVLGRRVVGGGAAGDE